MSESIDNLSPEAEVLFYRLIVQCDDYGRLDGRLSIIRSKCYPLRIDEIKDEQISNLMHELIQNDMVKIYTHEDKNYIQISTWDKHQQIRAKRSKYPEPVNILNTEISITFYPYQRITDDINSNHQQVISDDSNSTRNPIQSNPIRIRNPNPIIAKTTFSKNVVTLTNLLITLIRQNDEKAKIPEDIYKWAKDIDLLVRLDNRSVDDIEKVIKYAQSDNFWKTNILSAKSLRKAFPKLYLRVKFGDNGHGGQNVGGTSTNQKAVRSVPGNEPSGAFNIYEERDKKMPEV